MKDFDIQFVGLKQGTHFFEFKVDNSFFEEFECFDFIESNFEIELEFTKQSTIMLLNFSIAGQITVPCDRCLDPVDIEVEGEDRLIVKFGHGLYEETEEILVIPESENELNVAKYIYEFIEINIPRKWVHQDGFCNPEVIKELEKVKSKKEKDIDPRWSGLNDLKIEK